MSVPYRGVLDVPRELVFFLSRLLAAERRRRGTRRRRRALTPFRQAVLVLRWFRDAPGVDRLAADAAVSPATAYRYVHEGIDVLAGAAPDLHQVLAEARAAGLAHLVLDGTLIGTDRVAAPACTETGERAGHDLWYSGKHRRHGGNVQILTAPDGTPLWTSEVSPGSTHDLVAARAHALPALYPQAARGLPVLADKGYVGAGAGVHTPIKEQPGGGELHVDNRTYNALISALRAVGERGIAVLKTRWRALRHVSLDPWRIGDIVAAALVLNKKLQPCRY